MPEPVHPGEILAEALAERGMTQKDLAEETGLSPKHINRIVRGHSGFSASTAMRLEDVLGIKASFWMAAQAQYLVAREEADD